jgi:starch phosphorylase
VIRERLGLVVDTTALFDVHIKRIHEYKRQLLNLIETVALWQAMRAEPARDWVPRVKIFAGKAAAGYAVAKLIVKLANDIAAVINADTQVRDLLKVVFLPNYNVSLAEVIIPAADLSEQISTAGMEASGTGNMKLALNGALTIGTLDGANVEIRERVGCENIFIFGLRADEVAQCRRNGWNPRTAITASPPLARALDAIGSGVFSPDHAHRFDELTQAVWNTDDYMVTADFVDYFDTQRQLDALWHRKDAWAKACIMNIAGMGWFSSDRAIRGYAEAIWRAPL